MRICLVYDCLFPHTVGGAERWYRNLAQRLAADGHEVTYLTLRQWEEGEDPGVPGVRVVAAGPRMALYTDSGRRRVAPPLAFGAGVLWHLARHGRSYDVVHTCSFPYFSLLAAATVRGRGRFSLVVDWFEVWTRDYWREYLGPLGGWIGWRVQRACARVHQRAFCYSRLHADRLREEGMREDPTVLRGLQPMAETNSVADAEPPDPDAPVVVYAGRHIPEKRVPALVPAIARARRLVPGLTCDVYGDGPDRAAVEHLVAAHRLQRAVRVHGFVGAEVVDDALARALCLVLPSRREGYGMVVVEAAAHGTPSVVVAGPDNAAVELIAEGENGFVAASADPDDVAEAIARVHAAGPALRESTAAWFKAHRDELSIEGSLEAVAGSYARADVAA